MNNLESKLGNTVEEKCFCGQHLVITEIDRAENIAWLACPAYEVGDDQHDTRSIPLWLAASKKAWTTEYDRARGCSWPRAIYIPEAEYDTAIASGVWEHRWEEDGEEHLDLYGVFATYEAALEAADRHNIDNYDYYAGHPDIRNPDWFVVRRYGDPQEG